MTSKEAIKRLRQETCPCTYISDFDKEECLKIIEKDLEVLKIFKKHLKFKISDKSANGGSYIIFIDDFDDDYDYMCFAILEEEKDLLEEWLENE